MSTASDAVMEFTRHPQSSPINAPYLADERTARESERTESSFLDEIVGRRGSLRSILSQVEAVAGTNTTVLITGETGTGKEVIARAIHELSPRRNRNLVKVNCAAMPAGLLESGTCHRSFSPNCSASCRSVSSRQSAARGQRESMFALLRRPTRT